MKIVNHTDDPRYRGLRGMQADGTYVGGYYAASGTARARLLTVDGIEFVASTGTRDRGVWWERNGKTERTPRPWAQLISRLANASVRRDPETGHLFVNEAQLLSHFIDSHDASGNEVSGGRPSGLHFPVVARLGKGPFAFPEFPADLGKVFMTGKLDGKPVVSVLA